MKRILLPAIAFTMLLASLPLVLAALGKRTDRAGHQESVTPDSARPPSKATDRIEPSSVLPSVKPPSLAPQNGTPVVDPSKSKEKGAAPVATPAFEPPRPPSSELKAVVAGNNEFAFDLYHQLRGKKGNILFSPDSVSSALAMTYGGARGETAEQMAKVLHFTLDQKQLHPAFGELTADLQPDDPQRAYHLHVANRLWGQKGFSFEKPFLQLTTNSYRAGLQEVDFARDPEDGRKAINRWVEEQTKDKIKELLLSGDVDGLTRLVLTNAIYFKATWKTSFPKKQTRDAAFEVDVDKKRSVPMMCHPKGLFRYFAADDFQWLELPYKGDRLSMIVMLPRKKGALPGLEKALTASAIQKGLAKLHPQFGQIVLPRFRVSLRVGLGDELQKMGMPLAFSEKADFSGIGTGGHLRISRVIHKAYIDVDEVGTEAAAATAVGIGGSSGGDPFFFRADHPFVFLIRDNHTGSILFLGRISDPRE